MFKNSRKLFSGSYQDTANITGVSSKSNIKTTLRRSFMDAQDIKGIRKSSVNKKPKDDDLEENNSIGTDYSDDDMKDIEYHQRNKELYKILRKIGVCVIPDPRIKTADHLPYFSIIQDDIREKNQNSKRGERGNRSEKKKRKSENRDFDISHFKSIDFFQFLNAQSMMKNKCKKSPSLQKHHKHSKYAGISGAMGQKEEKEVLEKINIIYMEGEEKLKMSAHEKALMHLLESSHTGTKPLNLPESQDSVKIAMKRGVKKSINVDRFLKNAIGDNRVLDQNFLGNNVSFERGITGVHKLLSSGNKEKNELRNFMIEKLQEQNLQKMKKKKDSEADRSSKNLPEITNKNPKLNAAYMREKRKLELEMLKLNEKLGTTAKILNLIRYEKSPTPVYKFKEFKEKIALLNKYKDLKRGKNHKGMDSLVLGPTKKIKGKGSRAVSDNSSIIEDYEPEDSNEDSL